MLSALSVGADLHTAFGSPPHAGKCAVTARTRLVIVPTTPLIGSTWSSVPGARYSVSTSTCEQPYPAPPKCAATAGADARTAMPKTALAEEE